VNLDIFCNQKGRRYYENKATHNKELCVSDGGWNGGAHAGPWERV
jgi:hypothetical protein